MSTDPGVQRHEILLEARRARLLTQSELAQKIGVSQASVSLFERGRQVLSRATVRSMAEVLGVDPDSLPEPRVEGRAGARSLFVCPDAECDANCPDVSRGKLVFRPSMVEAPEGSRLRCRRCGEVLEWLCPNAGCRKPIREGSHCGGCGAPYVRYSGKPIRDPAAYVAARRRHIAETFSMVRVERFAEAEEADGDAPPGAEARSPRRSIHEVDRS